MWHKKQQNVGLPGQVRHPERIEGVHLENKILLAQSGSSDTNFLSESSRKRKSEALDQQGIVSESVLKYNFFGESNLQHKAGSLFGMNVQSNASVLFSPQSTEPIKHQSEKRHFHGQNDLAVTRQVKNVNDHKPGIEKISSYSVSVPPQSSCQKVPSTLIEMLNGETLKVPNWQSQARSFLNSCNTSTEKAAVNPGLQDLTGFFGHRDHVITNYSPMESYNSPSESLRPSVLMQQSLVKPDGFSVDGKSSSYKSSRLISSDLEQRQHSSNTQGPSDLINVGSAFIGASTCTRFEQNENCRLLQNEVQPCSAAKGNDVGREGQDHGDGMIKIMKKTEGSDIENPKNLLTERTSAKNDDSLGNAVIRPCQRNDQCYGSIKLDEKSKPLAGKVAQTVAEKLWDGSLQLNSAVTVTTVAFFKSGEKIPDVNWSEFVEVKGKVKLEAFEKYIKDLPRSRNRGLMVVSLHWKEGSSASGLAGMKQVAKGYKERERVGFAHLSPGTDIYVCPRSDAIITILAKYGFFKGMAAVEDNQDSLIGCVVWRRNQIPLNSVVKNSEGKKCSLSERPLNSPDSSTQPSECSSQVAEKKLSLPQPAKDPPALVTGRTSLQSSGDNDTKGKITKSTEVQLEVGNSQTGADSLPKPLVPSKSSSTSGVLQTSSHPDSASHQDPMERLLDVEDPLVHSSEPEKLKKSLELQKPVQPLPSGAMKQPLPTDDDDLPEFDFRTACGASQTPTGKSFDAMALERRLPPEGFRKMDVSVPLVIPNLQSMPILNQKSSENLSFPRLQTDADQGMPLPKNVCHRDFQIPVQPILGERYSVQGRATLSPANATTITSSKNRFDDDDDDDDMPEWYPPNLQVHKQPVAETTQPSTTAFPSMVPNSRFENLPPSLPRPTLFSPITASSHLPFPSQSHPRAFHGPIATTLNPAQLGPVNGYIQRGPNPMRGFNSSPALRPPTNPHVKLPIHPTDKRGWKP